MFISKNRFRTTSGKARKSSRQRGNTSVFARPERNRDPVTEFARQSSGCKKVILGKSSWRVVSVTKHARASAKTAHKKFPIASTTIFGPVQRKFRRRIENHQKYGPVHYDWHWFWNYGNGDLGNQGIHQMDIARWFLGEQHLSPRVWAVGGRLGYEDDGETPNTATVFHDYEKAPMIFEVRGLPESTTAHHTPKYMGDAVGASIECEGGRVQVPDYTKAIVFDKNGKEVKTFNGTSSHYDNFIKGVRSRKIGDLHADISEGPHFECALHTGNISYPARQSCRTDEIRERIKADRDAVNTFNRMVEHLGQNDVDLNKTKATLGQFLKMDVVQEKFIDNSDANALLTREYRKPFVVPTQV